MSGFLWTTCSVYILISVQPHRNTRSLDVVTLSCPTSSSSLKVNNCSFHHASPCLWNQLPKELRLPADHEDLSLSSDLIHVSSSFPSSPLSPSITSSLFHSRLKTYRFHKSFSSTFPPTWLTPRTPAVGFNLAHHYVSESVYLRLWKIIVQWVAMNERRWYWRF